MTRSRLLAPVMRALTSRAELRVLVATISTRFGIYVENGPSVMYRYPVEVAITELRAHLSEWLERARSGSEIVVTDRGVLVARLVGVSASDTVRRLAAEGLIAPPRSAARPSARGRRRATAPASVANLVGEQRRSPVAIVYFDSSAVVKLVVEEDGRDLAGAAVGWLRRSSLEQARISRGESGTCGGGKEPTAHCCRTAAGHDLAVSMWEELWRATRVVELTRDIEQHAGRLAAEHALRGADAVHPASSLAVGTRDLVVAVWDRRLSAGAVACALRVTPAEVPD
jgi:prevent-host-death family protein